MYSRLVLQPTENQKSNDTQFDNNSILDNLSTHKAVLRAKSIFSFSAKTITFRFRAIYWVFWKNNFEICVRSRGLEFYLKNKFRIGVFTKKPNQQLEYSKHSFVAVLCTQNSKTDLNLHFWKLLLGLCTTLFSVYFCAPSRELTLALAFWSHV